MTTEYLRNWSRKETNQCLSGVPYGLHWSSSPEKIRTLPWDCQVSHFSSLLESRLLELPELFRVKQTMGQ